MGNIRLLGLRSGKPDLGLSNSITSENFNPAVISETNGWAEKNSGISWVCSDVVIKAKNISEALEEFRYEPNFNKDGDITDLCFTGEKLGDDEELFTLIAPYIESGSFLQFSGEENCNWRWCFENLDLEAAVKLGYVAEVALLWGGGQRVVDDGQVQTVLVSLGGASREEAKSSLTSEYEFVRWW